MEEDNEMAFGEEKQGDLACYMTRINNECAKDSRKIGICQIRDGKSLIRKPLKPAIEGFRQILISSDSPIVFSDEPPAKMSFSGGLFSTVIQAASTIGVAS
ncbi:unnamed protein product [Lactuca saligna]|uniref:Uncharacterized protein n=1 Tax=Lactuca saligna TaxID=75948 RepID=A0AA36EHY2_LACSI|nr:unnamed protein product [Lactuca saligna]